MPLLAGRGVHAIYYGIGIPSAKHRKSSREAAGLVDFIVGVEEDLSVSVLYDGRAIAFA